MFSSLRSLNTRRKITIAAFLSVSVLLTELYLLPQTQKTEICANGHIKTSRTSTTTTSYETFFLVAESKTWYHVPEYVYNTVLIGDKFVVNKSLLFHRNLSITWCRGYQCYDMAIGTFNTISISDYLTISLLILTALIGFGVIKKGWLYNYAYAVAGLAFGVFAFYLVY